MLAALLCSLLAPSIQDSDPNAAAGIPRAGLRGARSLEHSVTAEADGALHAHVRAESGELLLEARLEGGDEPLSSAGRGGGVEAALRVEVDAGDVVALSVRSSDPDAPFELSWAFAVEDEATRSAAASAATELDELEDLAGRGEHVEARERLGALVEQLLDHAGRPESEALAAALHRAGALASDLSVRDLAFRALGAAVDVTTRLRSGTDLERLDLQNELADSLTNTGSHEEALEWYEQVIAGYELHEPEHRIDVAATRRNLSMALQRLGRYEESKVALQRAISELRELLPDDDLQVQIARYYEQLLYLRLDDYEAALPVAEEVYAAWRKERGALDKMTLAVGMNLALARKSTGDLEGAAELQEENYRGFLETYPKDHRLTVSTLSNLVSLRQRLGDYEGSLPLADELVAACRRTLPVEDWTHILARLRAAGARLLTGDPLGSRSILEETLADLAGLPEDDSRVAAVKGELALALNGLGDVQGARDLEEEILAIRSAQLPHDHPELTRAKMNLGATLLQLGELERARELTEEVLLARRHLPDSNTRVLRARGNLAAIALELGEHEHAVAIVRSYLASQRERLAELSFQSTRAVRAAVRRELSGLDAAPIPVLLGGDAELDAAVFDVIEAARAASTASAEVARAVARIPDLRPAKESLDRARRELDALSSSSPADPSRVAAWRQRVVALAEERDQAERELRAALGREGVRPRLPDAARLAERLAPNEALVSYYRVQEKDAADFVVPGQERIGRLLAFAVRGGSAVRCVDLGPGDEVEELIQRWRASLGKPLTVRGLTVTGGSAPQGTESELGAELRTRVIDPCLTALGDAPLERLYVVADDVLHLVPLDALPGEDGRLGDGLEIRYELSVRRLTSPAPPPARGTLVALGAVDYETAKSVATGSASISGARSRGRAPVTARFAPLAFTGPEVEAVAELYAPGEEREAQPVLLTGEDASAAALAHHASSARYLHVATHGWFLDDEGRELRSFAPELLCGLALAGANRPIDAEGPAAGLLTAEELATLDLTSCELAVLSACETNVGLRSAGQGIQSLRSALHTAGARASITSLWRVDDAATRRLMERFYRELWSEGRSPARALWTAKRELRDAGRPVAEWAGWVLTGSAD